jgi:hypothetical protein
VTDEPTPLAWHLEVATEICRRQAAIYNKPEPSDLFAEEMAQLILAADIAHQSEPKPKQTDPFGNVIKICMNCQNPLNLAGVPHGDLLIFYCDDCGAVLNVQQVPGQVPKLANEVGRIVIPGRPS